MRPGASCAQVEASMADDLRGVIDEMKLLPIALNPPLSVFCPCSASERAMEGRHRAREIASFSGCRRP